MSSKPPPTVPPPTVAPVSDAMIPWWAGLLCAIGGAILAVAASKYGGSVPSAPAAPPGLGDFAKDMVTFMPHILLLFGVLADIFTMEGVYSIPSVVGFVSIFLNYLFKFIWAGLAGVVGDFFKFATLAPGPSDSAVQRALGENYTGGASTYQGCEIQGFEFARSEYAPQGLVITATIFWYYLLDLLVNRNILDGVGTLVIFGIFFGGQSAVTACPAGWKGSLFALVEGLVIGGAGYGIVAASAPQRLPSSVLPSGAPSAKNLTKNASGQLVDSKGTAYALDSSGNPISLSFLADSCKAGGIGAIAASPGSCPAGKTAA